MSSPICVSTYFVILISNADQQTAPKATLLDFGGSDRVYGLWEHFYFRFFSKTEERRRHPRKRIQ